MALETLNTPTPEEEAPVRAPLATGTPVAAKGPYALPSGKSPVGVDPGLLENMQKLIAEREKQKGSFLESLKDANAWWSGGAAGPGEALRARAKEREEQEATTFGMKSQIAQYNAQQQAAQRKQANVLAALDGGGQGAGGVGVGGMATQVDPAIANQVRTMAQSNPEAAEKFLNDHLKKMAEITAAARLNKDSYAKVIEVRTADGKLENVSLMELLGNPQKYQPTEKGAPIVTQMTGGITPENIRTVESGGRPDAVSPKGAEGVMQVMPNTQTNPGFGVAPAKDKSPQELERVGRDYYAAMQNKYGHDTLAAIAYNMGPGKTDAWLKAGADFNKLPAETQAYIGKVNLANAMQTRQAPAAAAAPVATTPATSAVNPAAGPSALPTVSPLPKLGLPDQPDNFPVVAGEEKQAVTLPTPAPAPAPVAAPAAPVAAAPAAPRAPVTPVAQKTIPELRAEQAANAEFQKETAVGAGKNLAKQQEEFEANTSPTNVIEKRAANKRIIDLVMGSPNSVGLLEKPGMGAALATLAKNGLNTPSGAIGVQELEDALVKVMPGTDQKTINARNEIKQNLARGELEASKLAQGQGAVSDFERRLFAKVSGSTADTPELLIKRQMALVARENLNEKLGRLWGEQQTSGKAPNFAEFKNNPERRRLIAEYDKELNEILAKEINIPKSGAAKPAIPKYDAAKETRYQQWKQSQGIK
jgi:hypothetical protein